MPPGRTAGTEYVPLTPEEQAAIDAMNASVVSGAGYQPAPPPQPKYAATDAGQYAGAGAANPISDPYYPPPEEISAFPEYDRGVGLINSNAVPGSGAYNVNPNTYGDLPLNPSPGLGGSGENEVPRTYVPGSTYRPSYEQPLRGVPPELKKAGIGEKDVSPQTFIPGSTYVPPQQRPVTLGAEREGNNPAPRNYIPGSTFNPGETPDPNWRQERPPRMHSQYVMGSQRYGETWNTADAPIYAGLGGMAEPHPIIAARNPRKWMMQNSDQPQDFQPGSSYDPQYALQEPLGSPDRYWQPIVPGEVYGGSGNTLEARHATFSPTDLISGERMVVTSHPASGEPDTMRPTGYIGRPRGTTENSRIIEPERWSGPYERPYVFDQRNGRGLGPVEGNTTNPMVRSEQMAQMEEGRQARQSVTGGESLLEFLRGLYGSGR